MQFFYLYYILISLTISLAITPLAFKFLRRFDVLDKPNNRKIHKDEILTGGGVIIFLAFFICVALSFASILVLTGKVSVDFIDSMPIGSESFILSFFMGFSILFLMGIFDDKFNLSPKLKFLVQIISCSIFILFSDYHISFSFLFIDISILSFLLTLLFMLSIINAFNLIDGLDGLASGLALISLSSILLVLNHSSANYMICILIGSLFAFLIRNMRPAKVFLGDSGSYILGYSIAIFIILIANQHEFESWNLSYLLILAGIPAIDIIYAFSRRLLNRRNVFSADKKHIHHIILDIGLSHSDAVLVLYMIHSILCILGLALIGFKIGVSIIFFILPIVYLLFKYVLPDISSAYFKNSNKKNRQRFSSISLFISTFILFFFIIKMLNNSSIYLQNISTSQCIFIFSIALILSVFSIFNKQVIHLSIAFSASLIALDFNSVSQQWVDIVSVYIWYMLIPIVIINLFFKKSDNNYVLNLTDYIFFIVLIILSFSSDLDWVNFEYLSKIFLILTTYKIILKNRIVSKYRLGHMINLISVFVMLFMLIL